jgi:hypothetical protein
MNYKFSDQAVGAIMMALQKSLMEQSDIVPVFKEFQVQIDDTNHLVITNPPVVKADKPKKKSSPGVKIADESGTYREEF